MRYQFDVGCPRCGSDLTHLTGSSPEQLSTTAVFESKAAMRCTADDCQLLVAVVVQIAAVRLPTPQQRNPRRHEPRPRPSFAGHGSTTRYRAGCRCDTCKAASRNAQQVRRVIPV